MIFSFIFVVRPSSYIYHVLAGVIFGNSSGAVMAEQVKQLVANEVTDKVE